MCGCGCKRNRSRFWLILVLLSAGIVIILAVSGCQSTEDLVPHAGKQLDAERYTPEQFAAFDAGRDIYLRKCGTCHAIEPIDRYTLSRWSRILQSMTPKAKLNEEQTMLLSGYIMTMRRAMPDPESTSDEAKHHTSGG